MKEGEVKLNRKFSIMHLVFISFFIWIAQAGYAELIVSIDQPSYHITRNDEITLSVNIEGVATEMRGYQIDFVYDPEYLEIEDISSFQEGGFLSEIGRTEFLVAGEPGNYQVGCAILGITFGALDSGNLFTVTMKGKKATDNLGTDIDLHNVILRDPLNIEIPEDRIEGSNVIIDPILMYCKIKAFLHGPYISGGSMRHSLTSYLPLTSPYNSAHVIRALPNVNPNYIVDWVYVQLRDSYNGAVVQSQSCFLLQNGSVVDTTGSSILSFEYLDVLNHYVILRHRNHLGVMTSSAFSFALEQNSPPLIDLTALNSVFGGNSLGARQIEPGVLALFAGDANNDGRINNIDLILLWRDQNGVSGYSQADYSLSGVVDNLDMVVYWRINNGRSSQIP